MATMVGVGPDSLQAVHSNELDAGTETGITLGSSVAEYWRRPATGQWNIDSVIQASADQRRNLADNIFNRGGELTKTQ